ncbi:Anaphase-promoting complex subunit 10 [Trichoplax sp. H2]|uniref:Anaphase-promoting complex subunit 10 n=1 Tax=Trichoplax adhaerens TaxID=10228 RepID=B3RPW8_TRIAD|nr:hypothetical protein TRIADDRAFT_21690 [Trichoplax adhaerens]EDV27715.1 hypothetical protein TRIADDRAFT_21690 [Trichoplax adhaerens]RDD42084.1 Anaphase-promoting complex subunit 10 [Trichoplax sp. H2]|eukprot:XP_002109549.1 hypothetical protein TRIADDRAFT_21690 [Trichoplax adhaerens]
MLHSENQDDLCLNKIFTKDREVGNEAVWSVSSCKPGLGIHQLLDNSYETYWQSDGSQPHLINIQFFKKTYISCLKIYTDFKLDESYTPKEISVRVGLHDHDLHEIHKMELNEPDGWITIPLNIRAFLLQLAILSNHQNGRNSHLRQIKVCVPADSDYIFNHKYSNNEMRSYAMDR